LQSRKRFDGILLASMYTRHSVGAWYVETARYIGMNRASLRGMDRSRYASLIILHVVLHL
jgi:hypothetical protein